MIAGTTLRDFVRKCGPGTFTKSVEVNGFSAFFWDSAEPNAVIRAANSKHALERYFDKYRRRYKEYHDYDNKILRETTYGWGVFQVKNTRTEFKRYFH